jgi:hypothetical protein
VIAPPWVYHIECHSSTARLKMGYASEVSAGLREGRHRPDLGLDKSKRTIGDLHLPDGTNVNHTLVKDGWC